VRIAASPDGSMGPLIINGRPNNSSRVMAAFFVVHAGIFMGAHLLFLWVLFSGAWAKRIHGPFDFVDKIVIATDLWIPLLLLFLSRGVSFLFHILKPDLILRLEAMLPLHNLPPPPGPGDAGSIIGGFYARIMLMQVAIIFGAFIAARLDALAPLVILVVLKTLIDLSLHLALDFRPPATSVAVATG
jgi:hypothetical protein